MMVNIVVKINPFRKPIFYFLLSNKERMLVGFIAKNGHYISNNCKPSLLSEISSSYVIVFPLSFSLSDLSDFHCVLCTNELIALLWNTDHNPAQQRSNKSLLYHIAYGAKLVEDISRSFQMQEWLRLTTLRWYKRAGHNDFVTVWLKWSRRYLSASRDKWFEALGLACDQHSLKSWCAFLANFGFTALRHISSLRFLTHGCCFFNHIWQWFLQWGKQNRKYNICSDIFDLIFLRCLLCFDISLHLNQFYLISDVLALVRSSLLAWQSDVMAPNADSPV